MHSWLRNESSFLFKYVDITQLLLRVMDVYRLQWHQSESKAAGWCWGGVFPGFSALSEHRDLSLASVL